MLCTKHWQDLKRVTWCIINNVRYGNTLHDLLPYQDWSCYLSVLSAINSCCHLPCLCLHRDHLKAWSHQNANQCSIAKAHAIPSLHNVHSCIISSCSLQNKAHHIAPWHVGVASSIKQYLRTTCCHKILTTNHLDLCWIQVFINKTFLQWLHKWMVEIHWPVCHPWDMAGLAPHMLCSLQTHFIPLWTQNQQWQSHRKKES